ncbi:hypothetical protein ACTFIZ_007919 [Dictyostelium cf. discoideum]
MESSLDIDSIDRVVSEIMLKLLANKASFQEKKLIGMIYGRAQQDVRIILDEYDLLIYDLDAKSLPVKRIPAELLTKDFVKNKENKPYNSYLSALIDKLDRTHSQISQTLLNKFLYFELPSSQNPEVFGTYFQKGTDQPYISCYRERSFTMCETVEESNPLMIISLSTADNYFNEIIADIKVVRVTKKKDGITYQRPILIFANPLLRHKTHKDSMDIPNLWDELKVDIVKAGITVNELGGMASDAEVQQVERSGAVTLSWIENGRGAAIRGIFMNHHIPGTKSDLLNSRLERQDPLDLEQSKTNESLNSLLEAHIDIPVLASIHSEENRTLNATLNTTQI